MEREKLLHDVVENVERTTNKAAFEILLNSSEEHVLFLLDEAGGTLYPKQISRNMNVTMPRITMILNGMENKKLITRNISAEDRRKIEVAVTKKGKEAIKKRKKTVTEYVENITRDLDETELKAVLKFISAIDRVVNEKQISR